MSFSILCGKFLLLVFIFLCIASGNLPWCLKLHLFFVGFLDLPFPLHKFWAATINYLKNYQRIFACDLCNKKVAQTSHFQIMQKNKKVDVYKGCIQISPSNQSLVTFRHLKEFREKCVYVHLQCEFL